ncbi:hypothetical protein JTB14_000910 [Gonioctena quinquepunctata]|nr:hypothetical protein JTB14_000910 [Gonioctena quinquepunctata]
MVAGHRAFLYQITNTIPQTINCTYYTVSVTHLQILMKEYSEDSHFLVQSHLKPKDKMNFEATEKMGSDKVMLPLKSIPDSNGTLMYLKLMNYSLFNSCDDSLEPTERLYKICSPRENMKCNTNVNFTKVTDITDELIEETVTKSLSDALSDADELGLTVEEKSQI